MDARWVDQACMGRPNLLALVEGSEMQWPKIAAPLYCDVELISRASEREA